MVIFQPERILLRVQIRKYSPYVKGVVLDAGSGKSNRYSDFFDNVSKYITLDIDPDNNPEIIASVEDIPLSDESIDTVISTQVLEHLKSPELAIKEFYRVLKHGGYALVTIPQCGELHEEPNDYFRFTNFGIKYLFENAGFELVNIDQRGGFFSTIAQLKIRYLIDRFDLYDRKLTILFLPIFKLYGKFMIFLDKQDNSSANKKHALGWCLLVQKK